MIATKFNELYGKLMTIKIKYPEIIKKSIHHDIWVKTGPYTINLVKHTVLFFLTLLIIWFTIKFTELLFPNLQKRVQRGKKAPAFSRGDELPLCIDNNTFSPLGS